MRRSVFVLGFLLPLGACATPNPNVAAMACPGTAVLFQAGSVVKLRPGGKAASDVILTADMGPALLDCDYDMGDGTVGVDLRFPIMVRKGAAPGGTQRLTYFVVVLDSAGNILSKRVFDRDVDLSGGTGVALTEEVSGTEIKLEADKRPYDYQILTGFQLTADELAYNQAKRDARP